MKVLFVFLCIFVFEAISGDIENFSPELIESVFEAKCIKNANNASAFIEFKEALKNFKACGQTAFPVEPPNPVEDHERFCTTLKNSHFYTCVENLLDGLAPCLDDTELYLPYLFLHAVNTTYDELCGSNGLINSMLIFEMQKNSGCSRGHLFLSELECLNTLTVFKNLDNNIIDLNKQDVCTDLETLQNCCSKAIKKYCETDYSPILNLVFRPFTDECNVVLD